VANDNVSPLSPYTQFPDADNLENLEALQPSLHLAIIQESVRRWQRPWRHQRAIVLFAKCPQEMKERIQRERRIRTGDQVLRIISVGK
jgi:hypothetical protein